MVVKYKPVVLIAPLVRGPPKYSSHPDADGQGQVGHIIRMEWISPITEAVCHFPGMVKLPVQVQQPTTLASSFPESRRTFATFVSFSHARGFVVRRTSGPLYWKARARCCPRTTVDVDPGTVRAGLEHPGPRSRQNTLLNRTG